MFKQLLKLELAIRNFKYPTSMSNKNDLLTLSKYTLMKILHVDKIILLAHFLYINTIVHLPNSGLKSTCIHTKSKY